MKFKINIKEYIQKHTLTQEDIDKLNKEVVGWHGEQGIYIQPYGVPVQVKDHVVYMRWDAEGASGGSCYDTGDDDGARPYRNDEPTFDIFHNVCRFLKPDITEEQLYEAEHNLQEDEQTDYEYYGNWSRYKVKWILLKDLQNYLMNLKPEHGYGNEGQSGGSSKKRSSR